MRLRDIGGIVIIDYIDMQDDENKKKIIDILSEELKKDRSKTQVVGFSKLNLLEMTRKHICRLYHSRSCWPMHSSRWGISPSELIKVSSYSKQLMIKLQFLYSKI